MAFPLADETRGLSAVGSVILLIRTFLGLVSVTGAFVAGQNRARPAFPGDVTFPPALHTRSDIHVISVFLPGVDAVLFHVTSLPAFEADLVGGLVGALFGDVTAMLAQKANQILHAVLNAVTDGLTPEAKGVGASRRDVEMIRDFQLTAAAGTKDRRTEVREDHLVTVEKDRSARVQLAFLTKGGLGK